MIEFNDENFEEEVLKSEQLVLVDFWMPGCKPCLAIAPIVEELAKEFEGKAKIGKLNVVENPETPKKYKIPAVPTLIIFKNGEPTEKAVGLRPKQVLIDKINSLM